MFHQIKFPSAKEKTGNLGSGFAYYETFNKVLSPCVYSYLMLFFSIKFKMFV